MVIQHNISALNANRQLSINNNAVSKSLEKLSSGYRINSASDDAAGLAISEKMKSQITGLNKASDNAEDGVSLIQTGEGALTEVHSMLNRMVELATQSANGTYGTEERSKLQDEVTNLKDEIDRISESTNFNGINLLDGSMGSGTSGAAAALASDATNSNAVVGAFDMTISGKAGLTVKLNADGVDTTAASSASLTGDTLTINLKGGSTDGTTLTYSEDDINEAVSRALSGSKYEGTTIKLSNDISLGASGAAVSSAANYNLGFDAASVQLNTDGITTAEAANATAVGAAVTNTDGVSTKITVTADTAGANTNTLTVANSGTAGATTDVSGAVALNLDADTAYTATDINQMLSKAGAGMTVSFDGSLLGSTIYAGDAGVSDHVYTLGTDGTAGTGLASGGGLKLQVGDTDATYNKIEVTCGSMDSTSLGLGAVDVSSQPAAGASIDLINKAIEKVSTSRGNFGALQNRLEHTINNLSTTTENLTSAESNIRDVDMAGEMMEFTKDSILTQASQAMLAQANQLPQGVLQLLQ
ncbi:MAG: flagellin [Clostridia bacterium]|jgi:flagellin|nr:flagellin [Clostridia bacterium]